MEAPILGTAEVTLGEMCQLLRKRARLTQEDLAEQAKVDLRVLRRIEQDRQDVPVAKLSQVFAVFGFQLQVNLTDGLRLSSDHTHPIREASAAE